MDRMVKLLVGAAMLSAMGALWADVPAPEKKNFWIRYNGGVSNEKAFAAASNTLERAAKCGVTGIAMTCFDTLWLAREGELKYVRAFKRLADAKGIEIVPHGWTIGYATMTGVDSSLIESTLAADMPYVAQNGRIVPDIAVASPLVNGGLDEFDLKANTFKNWHADHPGLEAFVDTQVKRSGAASLRMEPAPEKDKHGHARFSQRVTVKPGRYYRFIGHMRAENMFPKYEALRMQVYALNANLSGSPIVGKEINNLDADEGWRKITVDFFSGEATEVILYLGSWGAKSGTFWIDDVSLSEIGIRELAKRKDSPRSLKNAKTSKVYVEGKDWTVGTKTAEGNVALDIPKGSAITEGEQLLFSAYIPARSGPKLQYSTCMSDPKLYDYFRLSAEAIERELHPKSWFLSLDEVRNGGTCDLCSARKTDMAHILGICVAQQHEIIRSVNPKAEIYAWSDMFDPYHNAKEKCCGCKGTFVGIWDLIPHDIVMMLWWGKMLPKSVPFFTARGFRTMGSVCCDSKRDIKLIAQPWEENLKNLPGNRGFMFTTWCNDFELLEDFAKTLITNK